VEPITVVAGIPNHANARTALLATASAAAEPVIDLDRCDSQSSAGAAALRWPDTMLKYDTRDATRRSTVRRAAAIPKD